jgi:hypothetical protein
MSGPLPDPNPVDRANWEAPVVVANLVRSNPTYWQDYNLKEDPDPNDFQRMQVVRTFQGLCSIRGLFKSNTAWNGAVPATFTPMWTLPEGFRPANWQIGICAMQDSVGNKYLGPINMVPDGRLILRYPEIYSGTSNGVTSFGYFIFNPWIAYS